jgi:hypothetical protein
LQQALNTGNVKRDRHFRQAAEPVFAAKIVVLAEAARPLYPVRALRQESTKSGTPPDLLYLFISRSVTNQLHQHQKLFDARADEICDD